MKNIRPEDLNKQVTLSYASFENVENVIDLGGPFSRESDPTRLIKLPLKLI
jgi:hypothetical protein